MIIFSYSLGRTEYLSTIGTPFITSTDLNFDYQSAEDVQPEAQVLVVPHLDPGFVSYGPADPRILRLMLLTWIRTLVLIHCCYEELQDPATPNQRGTLAFCQGALNRLTTREQESGFDARLEEARTAVEQYLHERGTSKYLCNQKSIKSLRALSCRPKICCCEESRGSRRS